MIVMFLIQRSSRCSVVGAPCTPTLATVPPGFTIRVQRSNVAGTPTASIATSTPSPPVISSIRASASSPPETVCVAPNALGVPQPRRGEVDRDDATRPDDRGGHHRREADRPRPDDRDRVPRADVAVLHPDLEARRQDVGEEQDLLVGHALGHRMDRRLGVGDAGVLGLHAVDEVAEDPADPAGPRAVGRHPALAGRAAAARRDRRDEHAVALLQVADRGARLDHRPDRLVAEDAALGHGRHVPLEDVQVRAADRRRVHLDDDVRRLADAGVGSRLPRPLTGPTEDECLHGATQPRARYRSVAAPLGAPIRPPGGPAGATRARPSAGARRGRSRRGRRRARPGRCRPRGSCGGP